MRIKHHPAIIIGSIAGEAAATAATVFARCKDHYNEARDLAHAATRQAIDNIVDGHSTVWQALAPTWAEVCSARNEMRAIRCWQRHIKESDPQLVADCYGGLPQALRAVEHERTYAYQHCFYAARAYRIAHHMLKACEPHLSPTACNKV